MIQAFISNELIFYFEIILCLIIIIFFNSDT